MQNIFLFTGENRYLLDQELTRRVDGFEQKYGGETVFSYGPENFDPSSLMQNILGGGLFANKKLIIIKHIPTDGFGKIPASLQEDFSVSFTKQRNNISPDVIVVFVSYKPDKRMSLYKFLTKNAQIKEFGPIKEIQCKSHIQHRAPAIVWENSAIDYLIAHVGLDLYRLSSEVSKLLLWSQIHHNTTITIKDIDTVVFGQVESNAFTLFDVLFVDIKKSLLIIDDIRDSGEIRIRAIGALYWGIVLFVLMIDMYENGIRDTKTIASSIGYSPFVVSKHFARIKTFVRYRHHIHALYQGLVDIDVSIKTGKLPAEAFWISVKHLLYTHTQGNILGESL